MIHEHLFLMHFHPICIAVYSIYSRMLLNVSTDIFSVLYCSCGDVCVAVIYVRHVTPTDRQTDGEVIGGQIYLTGFRYETLMHAKCNIFFARVTMIWTVIVEI